MRAGAHRLLAEDPKFSSVEELETRLVPGATPPARIAHAARLARSVNALCDHYENLRGS
ncbi:DUF6415 family natural product biosynthesis protein [Streptomyces sp. LZ34]